MAFPFPYLQSDGHPERVKDICVMITFMNVLVFKKKSYLRFNKDNQTVRLS